MNDQHTFAIMLRSMRDHGTDKRRASISLEVDAASAELLIRTMGEEVGLNRGLICKATGSEVWISLSSDNLPALSFVHMYVPWTSAAEARLSNMILSAHCLECKTYVGFDCWDHCVDTYCAACYDTRHIDVEDAYDPSDAELITDEVTA